MNVPPPPQLQPIDLFDIFESPNECISPNPKFNLSNEHTPKKLDEHIPANEIDVPSRIYSTVTYTLSNTISSYQTSQRQTSHRQPYSLQSLTSINFLQMPNYQNRNKNTNNFRYLILFLNRTEYQSIII